MSRNQRVKNDIQGVNVLNYFLAGISNFFECLSKDFLSLKSSRFPPAPTLCAKKKIFASNLDKKANKQISQCVTFFSFLFSIGHQKVQKSLKNSKHYMYM